jgi:hypothetical protein
VIDDEPVIDYLIAAYEEQGQACLHGKDACRKLFTRRTRMGTWSCHQCACVSMRSSRLDSGMVRWYPTLKTIRLRPWRRTYEPYMAAARARLHPSKYSDISRIHSADQSSADVTTQRYPMDALKSEYNRASSSARDAIVWQYGPYTVNHSTSTVFCNYARDVLCFIHTAVAPLVLGK